MERGIEMQKERHRRRDREIEREIDGQRGREGERERPKQGEKICDIDVDMQYFVVMKNGRGGMAANFEIL
jgi:hypothetical protein